MNKIIKDIDNMILVIADSPELFLDGIDCELLELLAQIKMFIIKNIKEEKQWD